MFVACAPPCAATSPPPPAPSREDATGGGADPRSTARFTSVERPSTMWEGDDAHASAEEGEVKVTKPKPRELPD